MFQSIQSHERARFTCCLPELLSYENQTMEHWLKASGQNFGSISIPTKGRSLGPRDALPEAGNSICQEVCPSRHGLLHGRILQDAERPVNSPTLS